LCITIVDQKTFVFFWLGFEPIPALIEFKKFDGDVFVHDSKKNLVKIDSHFCKFQKNGFSEGL